MSGSSRIGALVALVIVLVLAANTLFTVQQTQYALVLRFGEVVRALSEPGLYFKIPLVDTVISLDKRILDLDVAPQTVVESEQKQLVVDSFARYRIRDPLAFYRAVSTMAGANQQLQALVNAAVRGVIAELALGGCRQEPARPASRPHPRPGEPASVRARHRRHRP